MDVARNRTETIQSTVSHCTNWAVPVLECNKSSEIVKSEIFKVNLSEINSFHCTI